MPFKGIYMDELHQLMLEHEEFLEEALTAMEYGALLTDDQVNVIRSACGKPKQRKNPVLVDMFNDFGNIFRGNNHA
jgi:hypothetical protein